VEGYSILKAKDEKILTALLTCGNVADAERIAGVSRSTIYNRLSNADFKAEYDHRRTMVLNEACNTLQATLTKAVNTVKEIAEDETASPQVRLNACGMLLQNCLKYVEQIDILSRIEALENNTKK